MSKKKRKNAETSQELTLESEQQQPKIPFQMWFDKMVKAGKVRDYQDEALLVFFAKKGLKSSEDADTYNRAFENF